MSIIILYFSLIKPGYRPNKKNFVIPKIFVIVVCLPMLFFSTIYLPAFYNNPVYSQSKEELIKSRNLEIDLGNGLKTYGQLTMPAIGVGKYPAVLLIQGSGPMDMDETLGLSINGEPEPPKPFLQIANFLSERGFVVLRFNKKRNRCKQHNTKQGNMGKCYYK